MFNINKDIWNKIRSGEIDINNQELFFSLLIKGFMYDLNTKIRLYERNVPHMIVNTGDDTMYLLLKGQNMAIEPKKISNEDYIYNYVPRCNVSPGGITLLTDQLTNPYSRGICQVEDADYIISFNSEFRRIPVKLSFELTYYADSFNDLLRIIQQLISRMAFVNKYSFVYMGQEIECSYQLPDSFDKEMMMEFDGITTDDKKKKCTLSMEVESNMPVFCSGTTIPINAVITKTKDTIETELEILKTHENNAEE